MPARQAQTHDECTNGETYEYVGIERYAESVPNQSVIMSTAMIQSSGYYIFINC